MKKYRPVISAFGMLRQEDYQFKASLDFIVRPCLKKKKRCRELSMKVHTPGHSPALDVWKVSPRNDV
jgi:hypothetical protein